MPTDLELIKELGREIGIILSQVISFNINETYRGRYQLDEENSVIRLALDNLKLDQIPSSVYKFKRLEYLSIYNNKISYISPMIAQLENLKTLYLSRNIIQTLPTEITKMQNLSELYLSRNQLEILPPEILRNQNLTVLNLSGNNIDIIPSEVYHLRNLTTLHFSGNKINLLTSDIRYLQNLVELYLIDNRLIDVPPEISMLKKLKGLYLSNNLLTTLPPEIGELNNLQELYISGNRLTSLPLEITQLTNLQSLSIENNQIAKLPHEISRLTNLRRLWVQRNPLKQPPPVIAFDVNNIDRIRDYFIELQQQGEDYIYEAKLTLVGEPGAGKTSLAKKLLNPNYKLQENEEMTRGIDIESWEFPYSKNIQFQCNIWDFGGQEIMHATHRYFLTERALYILVVDNRKEDCDFYYWLETLEVLTSKSPVIIVNNEKFEYKKYVPEEIISSFRCIKEVYNVNLKTNRGISDLTNAIKDYLRDLPHVGKNPIPKKWVQIRKELENDNRDYITLQEYYKLCAKYEIYDTKKALYISQFLHDLGALLHFQEDLILKNTLILNTRWATEAVYLVLLDNTVTGNGGRFVQNDLARVWSAPQYDDKYGELLQLMLKFELCYQIEKTDVYIIPELLPDKPLYDKEYWNSDRLRERGLIHFEYRYDFMPKGIISRLIVRMNKYIYEGQQWKSGVILKIGNSRAEILEHHKDKKLKIRVTGSDRLDDLTMIRYEVGKLHDTFDNLQSHEMVPCNCDECCKKDEPHFFDFDELKQYKNEGEQFIKCRVGKIKNVGVLSLISDVNPKTEYDFMSDRKRNLQDEEHGVNYIDNSTNIYGAKDTIIATHSKNVTQSVSRNKNIGKLLEQITDILRKDETLRIEQLMKYLTDIQALKEELSAEKPQKSIVERYLNNLGSVASIASLVSQISPYLPALF